MDTMARELAAALEPGLTPAAARALQQRFRAHCERGDRLPPLQYVAGVDVGYEDGRRVARGAAVVLEWPSLHPVEQVIGRREPRFPYVPGLLSFRELPAILAALEQLQTPPDLVFCDGQGIAHPRRFGIACHLGLLIDCPTIGVGKSRLTGTHEQPGRSRGATAALTAAGETIGTVVRTRTGVRPLYVSPGHRVAPSTATRLVLEAAPRYRLPEPIRAADRLASNR